MAALLDVVALTRELVEIPSESSLPTATDPAAVEMEVLACLVRHARDAGLSLETDQALPGRSNGLLRLPNPGAPRLLLVAHMDTVSGGGMRDPFRAEIRAGRIHGRGSCDDKGPLASAFATLVNAKRAERPLTFDITFAATVDEECSMSGATRLAERLNGWDLCIALEPTRLRVVTAHKGVYRFLVHTRGRAAHSSTPEEGDNAIHRMLEIIRDLQIFGERLSMESDPQLGVPCLSLTRIEGGSSLNIIPERCSLGVDVRILPDTSPLEIADAIRAAVGDRGEVEEVYQGAGIRADGGLPLIRQFLAAHEAVGEKTLLDAVPFATDCAKLVHRGPCIVWGPGDIAQAHKPGEFIAIDQLKAAGRVLERFICS